MQDKIGKYKNIGKHVAGGRTKQRDVIGEGQVSPKCVVCGDSLLRKTNRHGLESFHAWFKRKTCGKTQDDLGHWTYSECLKQYLTGEGNSNYKGIMPRCLDCGKKIAYITKKDRKEGYYTDAKRCQKCFKKWALQTGWYTEHAKKIMSEHSPPKGVVPKQLLGFQFQKGMKAHNKIHDFCTIEGCGNKHLAKGLCSRHYYKK